MSVNQNVNNVKTAMCSYSNYSHPAGLSDVHPVITKNLFTAANLLISLSCVKLVPHPLQWKFSSWPACVESESRLLWETNSFR